MSARLLRTLSVLRKYELTPHIIRIILGGKALKDFPENQESAYIKLHFPFIDAKDGDKPRVRSYTIRAFDAHKLELTLDFVYHGDNGPASAWASSCNVGDEIVTDGPGPVKLVDVSADWFLIAGDMSALPAISVNLEKLPASAKGYAIIEVLSEDDQIAIDAPSGINIQWAINAQPDMPNAVLTDAVKSIDWLSGVPNIWVACEFESMRSLRRYFKQERQVTRGTMYASSYWKIGDTDEGHKAAKRLDTEAE